MRILFTGASSFSGYHFVTALAGAGHEVVCPLRGGLAGYLSKYTEALELMWFQYVIGYDKQEQHSLITSLRKRLMDFQRESIIKIDRARLIEVVRQRPDATLSELRDRLGVKCAISSVCVALKKLAFTFKKRSSTRRNRIVPTSCSAGRTGATGPEPSMPAGSSSSMRRGSRPT